LPHQRTCCDRLADRKNPCIPTIYPWFEKMGVKRQKAYLASRAKDTPPEGTTIPERERAEAL
jgi:hypothetical protein